MRATFKQGSRTLALGRSSGPPGVRWRRNTCPLPLICLFFLSSSYPSCHLSPSHPSRSPPGVYVHVPPSVTGPVSCQVSSLLALSMSQRSDKSEPGVGLSLPLATEVSFPPSIIHTLFNLTRWKWPRSVRTSSGGEANAVRAGVEFSSARGGQSACRERRGNYSSDPKFCRRGDWNDTRRFR